MKRALHPRETTLLLIGLVAVTAGLLYLFRPQPPATYQGRNAYEWAVRLEWPPDKVSREEAAAALRAMGTNALPLLRERFSRKQPVFVKVRLWLGDHLPGKLGRAVVQNLQPLSHVPIRCAAAQGLKALGTNAAPVVPEMIGALRDPDQQLMWFTASALGEAGEAAVLPLIPLLDDPSHNVRNAAAFALGQVGPPALIAAPALVKRADDPFKEVRDSALHALSRIGQPVGPAVLRLVETTEGTNRLAALKALVAVHPRGQLTLPVLLKLANDPDPAQRAGVVDCLRQLRITHPDAMQVYFAGLSDTNAVVREASARALEAAAHKSGGAVETLRLLRANDPDDNVRVAANEALARIAEVQAAKAAVR